MFLIFTTSPFLFEACSVVRLLHSCLVFLKLKNGSTTCLIITVQHVLSPEGRGREGKGSALTSKHASFHFFLPEYSFLLCSDVLKKKKSLILGDHLTSQSFLTLLLCMFRKAAQSTLLKTFFHREKFCSPQLSDH